MGTIIGDNHILNLKQYNDIIYISIFCHVLRNSILTVNVFNYKTWMKPLDNRQWRIFLEIMRHKDI